MYNKRCVHAFRVYEKYSSARKTRPRACNKVEIFISLEIQRKGGREGSARNFTISRYFFDTRALTVRKKVVRQKRRREMFDRRKIPRRHVSFRTVGKAEAKAELRCKLARGGSTSGSADNARNRIPG